MLPNVKVNENKGKATILQKGAGKLKQADFFYTIQEYFKKGYALPLQPDNWDRPLRNFRGNATGRVVMYAEGKDPSLSKEKEEKDIAADLTLDVTKDEDNIVPENDPNTPKPEDKPVTKKTTKATKKSK